MNSPQPDEDAVAVGCQERYGQKAEHGRCRRARAAEGLEEESERALHLLIGIELNTTVRTVDESDGQRGLQLAPTGLVQNAAAGRRAR
jgi:hypothetical protein